MGLWKSLKKVAMKVSGADDAAAAAKKKAENLAKLTSAGKNEDIRKIMEQASSGKIGKRARRAARGRESTIIAAGSQIQSRSLLG